MEQQAGGPPPGPAPAGGVDYDTVFTNAKAGMEGVDPELVKKVVYEASKVLWVLWVLWVHGHCHSWLCTQALPSPRRSAAAAGHAAL